MFARILFVCTGNICRSPMAEGLFKNYFNSKNINIHVSSAGLAALVNHPATPLAQSLLYARQIDISPHRARQLVPALVLESDLILIMENEQKKQVERLYPHACGKVFLLGKWSQFEVPDPYGGSSLIYEEALTLIEMGLKDWQKKLCKTS